MTTSSLELSFSVFILSLNNILEGKINNLIEPIDLNSLISVAPVDEAHAANRARWVKFSILLYNYDIETEHCLLGITCRRRLSSIPRAPQIFQ